MTRGECESLMPGMKCLIGDDFVEDPHESLNEYLGTVQTVERIESGGTGWIYFKGLPQPFAFSEVASVYEAPVIDDETVPYSIGDIDLILGEV